MASGVTAWSTTAATNATADSTINWAEGQAPSSVNDSARALMARIAEWRDSLNGTNATGGGTTAYTLTSDQTFAALAAGLEVAFQINATNTGTTTLNVDSLGAKPLRSAAGVELLAGSLLIGAVYRATYFTSNSGEWLIQGYPVLGDAQIAAAKLASNAVTTAKILDANVTLAKLADLATQKLIGRNTGSTGVPEAISILQALNWLLTTRGDIITRGASDPQRLALGAARKVLTSDGTDAGWALPSRDLIATLTASTSAELSDTTSFTSTYKYYDVELNNLIMTTNATDLRIQIQSGGSFKTSGYVATSNGTYSTLAGLAGLAPTTYIPMALAATEVGSASPGLCAKLKVHDPSANAKCLIRGDFSYKQSGGNVIAIGTTGGWWDTAGVVTGIKVITSSSTIASGEMKIYGYN